MPVLPCASLAKRQVNLSPARYAVVSLRATAQDVNQPALFPAEACSQGWRWDNESVFGR